MPGRMGPKRRSLPQEKASASCPKWQRVLNKQCLRMIKEFIAKSKAMYNGGGLTNWPIWSIGAAPATEPCLLCACRPISPLLRSRQTVDSAEVKVVDYGSGSSSRLGSALRCCINLMRFSGEHDRSFVLVNRQSISIRLYRGGICPPAMPSLRWRQPVRLRMLLLLRVPICAKRYHRRYSGQTAVSTGASYRGTTTAV